MEANLLALAAIGIAASVIGAFYYLKVVKVMYFDEAVDKVRGAGDLPHYVPLTVTTVLISPLGYLLTRQLGALADTAARALLHVA